MAYSRPCSSRRPVYCTCASPGIFALALQRRAERAGLYARRPLGAAGKADLPGIAAGVEALVADQGRARRARHARERAEETRDLGARKRWPAVVRVLVGGFGVLAPSTGRDG